MASVAASRPARGAAVAALHHRNFAIFWTGALVSNIGTWIQTVTVPYVLYKTTDSAAWVGLAGFCQFIPGVIMGPWSGAIADRFNRRRVLMTTQTALAFCALGLWLMWEAGVRSPGALVAVVFATGVIAALNIPTWQAFVTELVPKEDLLNAVTLNSAQFNAARAIGPALGGLVLATLGPSWAFLLNAISYIAVIFAVWLVRVPVRRAVRTGQHVLKDFFDACRYVRNHRGILICIALVFAVAFLANPMLQLAAVFTESVFGAGAAGLGLLTAAFGIGAVVATPFVTSFNDRFGSARLVGVSITWLAASVIAFGLSTELWQGALAMFATGMAYLVMIATLNTTVQLSVDENVRGRVLAVYFMTFTAGYPLGSLLQGWLSQVFSPRVTVATSGCVLLAIAGALWFRPSTLHAMDGHRRPQLALEPAMP
jgi:MFS family permease